MGHNANVPFTLAHGAAVLPLRRLRLVTSGLFVGAFAPDFEYFLRLAPDSGFGHTLIGTFVLTLPLALLVLWLFHEFIKVPLVKLLPDGVQRRLGNDLDTFRFAGSARFALVVVSILLGIATHLAWDSFTHPHTWVYDHWPVLSRSIHMPIAGSVPLYKALQHGSTIAGTAILALWLALLYLNTEPANRTPSHAASPAQKAAVSILVVTIALAGAVVRAMASAGIPTNHAAEKRFAGLLVVTAIALLWWQLLAYGMYWSRRARQTNPQEFESS